MTKIFSAKTVVGVLGAGAMGTGIAQVAATRGHTVVVYDTSDDALDRAKLSFEKFLTRQVEKGNMTARESELVMERLTFVKELEFGECNLVIEAIVEDLTHKRGAFKALEQRVKPDCVLATNTSSLSVTAIAGGCKRPERVLGLHFFNPVPLMPLVEVVPGIQTNLDLIPAAREFVVSWGKVPVVAKDTPGFIVNRLARPFYGESIRILEEGIADIATIDWAMKTVGGFRMGPFELMDLIGNDVNFAVTQSVFASFFFDSRYRPSITQQRLAEAGHFGRKSGRGYYDYRPEAELPAPQQDKRLAQKIVERVVCMLINEAVEALHLRIASREDLDLAMTKGVNYPKGLLAWADELGPERVLKALNGLQEEYGEDRYRPSVLLRRMVEKKESFF